MSRERIYVHACRRVQRDDEQRCDVLRTFAYRAASSTGWQGPYRSDRREAVKDAATRRAAPPAG